MTLVAAICKEDTVYMGADTCSSSGKNKANVAIGECAKIKIFPNGVFLGASGRVKSYQALIAHPELFSFADEKLTKDGIVKNFLPAVIKFFKERKELDEDGDLPISMLLAKEGDLFVISRVKSVYRLTDGAIGSGSDCAYLALRDKDRPPRERLTEALRMATVMDAAVAPPFLLVDTKEKVFTEVAR